jgi:hypothetical protein
MIPMLNIVNATMTHKAEDGYLGKVEFTVERHKVPYEITLHSKNAKEWSYSLNFARESGTEEDILFVEDLLEENDELFDRLVNVAKSKLVG